MGLYQQVRDSTKFQVRKATCSNEPDPCKAVELQLIGLKFEGIKECEIKPRNAVREAKTEDVGTASRTEIVYQCYDLNIMR